MRFEIIRGPHFEHVHGLCEDLVASACPQLGQPAQCEGPRYIIKISLSPSLHGNRGHGFGLSGVLQPAHDLSALLGPPFLIGVGVVAGCGGRTGVLVSVVGCSPPPAFVGRPPPLRRLAIACTSCDGSQR
eukprot:scaffold4786_cov45-Prasinocladus_malaysianus.AAC.1